MLARLVVLPLPVGPVTRNSPRGRQMTSLTTIGRPSCSNVRNSRGICRKTRAICPRCLKMATRNRALSPYAKPKSVPPTSCSSCWLRSGVMLFISDVVSSGPRTLVSRRTSRPCRRTQGGCPVVRCKSLAPSLTTVSRSLSIWSVAIQYSRWPSRRHYWRSRLPNSSRRRKLRNSWLEPETSASGARGAIPRDSQFRGRTGSYSLNFSSR